MKGSAANASARIAHLLTLGRLEVAENLVRQALAESPHDAALLRQLSAILHDTHRNAEALEAADAAVAEEPSNEQAHRLRAAALSELGRHSHALEATDVALRLDPHSHRALLSRATALYKAKDYTQAAETSRRAIALAPELMDGHLQLAGICHALRDAPGARDAIAHALALEPDNARALWLNAVLKAEADKPDDALHGLIDVAALAPRYSKDLLKDVTAVVWRLTVRPWFVLILSAIVITVTTRHSQRDGWLQPSAVVRLAAALTLIPVLVALYRLRGSVNRRTFAPMRAAVARAGSLKIFLSLWIGVFAVQVAIAVTGIGVLIAASIAMIALAVWTADRAGRKPREKSGSDSAPTA